MSSGAKLGKSIMESLFEWDEEKAESNLTKHKVSFEEAKTIFADENSITILIPDTRAMRIASSILECPPREESW